MSRLAHAPSTLYWALLPRESGVARSTHGEDSDALPCFDALQHEIPAPLEELAICLVPTQDGRTLACAIPRERLASVPPDILSAGPATLPDFAPSDIDPAQLNFLQGSLEPAAVRVARRWRMGLVLVCGTWLVVAMGVGLERRTRAWQEQAQQIRAATQEVLRVTMGASGPQAMQDLAERVESLSRASKVQARDVVGPDASLALERWLASIARAIEADAAKVSTEPAGQGDERRASLRSIRVTSDRVDVSLELRASDGDVEAVATRLSDATARVGALLAAWKVPDGWRLDQPRMQTRLGIVQVDVSARSQSLGLSRTSGGEQ